MEAAREELSHEIRGLKRELEYLTAERVAAREEGGSRHRREQRAGTELERVRQELGIHNSPEDSSSEDWLNNTDPMLTKAMLAAQGGKLRGSSVVASRTSSSESPLSPKSAHRSFRIQESIKDLQASGLRASSRSSSFKGSFSSKGKKPQSSLLAQALAAAGREPTLLDGTMSQSFGPRDAAWSGTQLRGSVMSSMSRSNSSNSQSFGSR